MLLTKINNFIYYHIFRILEFLIFDKTSYEWLKFSRKNEDKLNNFDHKIYNEKFKHPFVNLKYLQKLSELNPVLAYQKLLNYSVLRKNWLKSNMKYFDIEDYIPEQQVMGSFGNYATLFYYLFYRINILDNKDKPKLSLKNNEKVTNKNLFNYFKPYLNTEYDTLKFYKNRFKMEINKIPLEISLPYKNKYYPISYAINFYNQATENKNLNFNYFKLNQNHIDKGKEILNKIGIKNNDWYVVMHIRDIGDTHDFRNSNPNTYLKTVKKIISNGGHVIRMGRNEKVKFPEIKGLIDYPFSNMNSNFMDIFLAATCKFCVGTSSGFASLPTYFNNPLMLVNTLPTGSYFELKKQDIFLPKILSKANDNKFINVEEYFNFPIGTYFNNEIYEKNNLVIRDNTEEELESTVVTMIDKVFNKNNNNKNYQVKNKIESHSKLFFETPLKCYGDLSKSFLDKLN